MHPLAFAEAPVPTATPNTSNATSIFIMDLLEPAGLSRESRLFGSFALTRKLRLKRSASGIVPRMDLGDAFAFFAQLGPLGRTLGQARASKLSTSQGLARDGKFLGLHGFSVQEFAATRACAATNCCRGICLQVRNFGCNKKLR